MIKIDGARFGSITIDGETYSHDVLIRLDGTVKKRKKKLSKAVYGTSHRISLEEAQHVYQEGAERLIVGTGHTGRVTPGGCACRMRRRRTWSASAAGWSCCAYPGRSARGTRPRAPRSACFTSRAEGRAGGPGT